MFTCLISTSLFTFLYMVTNYKWLLFLPIIPYFVALLITINPVISIEAVGFYPAGLAFIYALKKKFSRTSTIITVSSALILSYIIYILFSILITYKTFNLEILRLFWSEATQPLRDTYTQATTILDGREIKLYTKQQVENIISNILIYIPATLMCVGNIIAFASIILYKGLARVFGVSRYIIPEPKWDFSMSVISAYIYCGSYLIVIFSGGSIIGTVTAVTSNILVILTPGFSYIGLLNLIYKLKSGTKRKTAIALIFLTVVFVVISPSMIFYIMSLTGVVDTFMNHYTIRRTPE